MMKNTAPALQDIRKANETCSNYNTIPISSTHETLISWKHISEC